MREGASKLLEACSRREQALEPANLQCPHFGPAQPITENEESSNPTEWDTGQMESTDIFYVKRQN